jgi:hypothetical protein
MSPKNPSAILANRKGRKIGSNVTMINVREYRAKHGGLARVFPRQWRKKVTFHETSHREYSHRLLSADSMLCSAFCLQEPPSIQGMPTDNVTCHP